MNLHLFEKFRIALVLCCFFFAGCASGPEVKKIEKAPGVMTAPKHLLVLAITDKEQHREIMETALVSRLERLGYQAEEYGQAPEFPWRDPARIREKVEERLQSSQADGVLTVSLVRKNKRVEQVPHQVIFNPVTVSIGPLASATYVETYDIPAHVEETTEYILRTTLFSVESQQAIWQMYSSTVDPTSLEKAAESFARVVVRELDRSFRK